MLKWLLRIILAPAMLVVKMIVLFLTFLLSVSTTLLSILASLLGLFAVLVFFVDSKQNGLYLMIMAWLISPWGIPLAAAWLLNRMDDLWASIKRVIFH